MAEAANVVHARARPVSDSSHRLANLDHARALACASTSDKPVPEPASKTLHIIHFNDVYNIQASQQEPCGGVARFVAKVQQLRATNNPLVLFSGDAFNPSIMSTITRGEQMPPCLNNIGVHCAAVGNHDLDFGEERMEELINQCNFPWLMANVLEVETNSTFPACKQFAILEHNGVKVGIMGLVEFEWLATLATLDLDDIIYLDFVEEGRRLAAQLRGLGCEVVIALTHCRMPNDILLGQAVPELDLILGGHDHHYEVYECPPHGIPIFKSGTDFREFSLLEITLGGPGKPKVTWERVEITSDLPEDPDTAHIVSTYLEKIDAQMEDTIGRIASPLDGRFAVVRSQESNAGNFVCDVLRFQTGADVAIINSGTLRSDMIHAAGEFRSKDLLAMLPMMDNTCLLGIRGETLLRVLNNGVCKYPAAEGRFLQVSGLRFEFDPSKPPGQRIDAGCVFVGDQPLDLAKEYTLATKAYLLDGKDGFGMLSECKIHQPPEDSPLLQTMVSNHFEAVRKLNAHVTDGHAHSCKERASSQGCKLQAMAFNSQLDSTSAIIRWCSDTQEYLVAPCVEGRIVCLSSR